MPKTKRQQEEEAKQYLKHFDLKDNQFILGIYQTGITIHNQQIRALNIFYCLTMLGKIKPDTSIGIIGGGFAGVTFAAAALNFKAKVTLFEKMDMLLPLQTQCKTRPIHPNIYDWPLKHGENRSTDLPVLNWTAGETHDVVVDVLKQFKEIEQIYQERGLEFSQYYLEKTSTRKIKSIDLDKKSNTYDIIDGDGNLSRCEIIIYAIGFGLEISQYEPSLSYWQCMTLAQANLYQEKLLITGLGDGAFMDVIMALVHDFNYDDLLSAIHNSERKNTMLSLLQDVRTDFFKMQRGELKGVATIQKDFVYNRFSGNEPYFAHIIANLKIRDRDIVFNGKMPLNEIFDLKKVSVLNALLVFLLKDKFNYIQDEGIYDKDARCLVLNSKKELTEGRKTYFRWGTDRKKLLKEIPGLEERIKSSGIEKLQKESLHDGSHVQLLANCNDFYNLFRKGLNSDIININGNSLQFFETWVASLSASIKNIKPDCNFRLTIHKFYLENGNRPYYRQIAPYYGSDVSGIHGGYGRVFEWSLGSVGYAILKGKPTLMLRHQNEGAYLDSLNYLNLDKKITAYTHSPKKCMFSLPIMAYKDLESGDHSSDDRLTNFVLYLDSEMTDFFDDGLIFETLKIHMRSFISLFETLIDKEQIKTVQKENPAENPHVPLSEVAKGFFKYSHGDKIEIGKGNLFGESLKIYQKFLDHLDNNHKDYTLKEFYNLS